MYPTPLPPSLHNRWIFQPEVVLFKLLQISAGAWDFPAIGCLSCYGFQQLLGIFQREVVLFKLLQISAVAWDFPARWCLIQVVTDFSGCLGFSSQRLSHASCYRFQQLLVFLGVRDSRPDRRSRGQKTALLHFTNEAVLSLSFTSQNPKYTTRLS